MRRSSEIRGQNYDADEEDSIRKINPKEYVIEGAMKLDDLDDQLGLDLKSRRLRLVGGYIIGLLGPSPAGGGGSPKAEISGLWWIRWKTGLDKVHLYILDAPQKTKKVSRRAKPNSEVTEPRQN